MKDEEQLEQLKRKVKLQRIQIVCMSITLLCFSVLIVMSLWESRTDTYKLQQMKTRVEQLEKEVQRIIDLKAKTENEQEKLTE